MNHRPNLNSPTCVTPNHRLGVDPNEGRKPWASALRLISPKPWASALRLISRNALASGLVGRKPWASALRLISPKPLMSMWIAYGLLMPVGGMSADLIVSPVLLKPIEEASLPALQEGAVVQIHVQEGQAVTAEHAVVQIDDRLARFRKEMAEVEYKIASKKALDLSSVLLAQTEIKVADANLQRALESRKRFRDTPSQAEVDELELRLAQSRQHLEKAQNEVELAKLSEELAKKTLEGASFEWQRYSVKSPIAGTIVEVIARPGDWVRPGQGLARVVRTDRLRAEGHVRRDAIGTQLAGRMVEFVLESNPIKVQRFFGKITFVSLEVDPNDRGQRIVAEIDNSQGQLGPGLRGKLIVKD